MSFAPVRCSVPIFHDEGSKGPFNKYYLVTGVNVAGPGAYSSWQTADTKQKAAPSSTLKGYGLGEWVNLEAAWHAGCARGEHPDRACFVPSIPPLPTTPSRTRAQPSTPRPHRQQPSPPRHYREPIVIQSRTPSPEPTSLAPPAGLMAYAVRSGGVGAVGQVFDDLEDARALYHALQRDGTHPVLGVYRSLTEAVSFIEGTAAATSRRQQWIREELAAHAVPEGTMSDVSDVSSLGAWSVAS
ncbi:hypothetical protein C8R46DRAFT_1208059 [Mycena filopes]|nr:hypothetical protein C8R46DRAFT_1208059 [Mycena filopes]